MNVIETDNIIEVKINAFKAAESNITVESLEKYKIKILKPPNSIHSLSFQKPAGNYSIDVPGLELHYNNEPKLIKGALTIQGDCSKYTGKTFLKAKDAQRYRDYQSAETLLKKLSKKTHFILKPEKNFPFSTIEMVIMIKPFQLPTQVYKLTHIITD